MLEVLIATWQEMPRDEHLLLTLLPELLTSLQRCPGDVVVSKISGLSGKTKASTFAARLIALRSVDEGIFHQHALLERTRTRIERAERFWIQN
jgi:hypothetical protein